MTPAAARASLIVAARLMALGLAALAGGLSTPIRAGAAPPAGYAAEQVVQLASMTVVSTIRVQGEKRRIESRQGQTEVVSIQRGDKGEVWILWPHMRAYTNRPIPTPGPTEADPTAGEQREMLGTETVGAYQTRKVKVTGKTGQGQPVVYYLWEALNLGGLVVRRQSSLGQVELRNVVIGPQPDHLFEIPEGYRPVASGTGTPGTGQPAGK